MDNVFWPFVRLLLSVAWFIELPFRLKANHVRNLRWGKCTEAGLGAFRRDEKTEAEEQLQAALKTAQDFEPTDPRLAQSFRNLAELHGSNGVYGLMASAIENTIQKESDLGRKHRELAAYLHRLGDLFFGLTNPKPGWGGKAVILHSRALAIRAKALGPDHPDVADSLDKIAAIWTNDKNDDSGPMYRRALAIREKTFGPEHLAVTRSLDNLAGFGPNSDFYLLLTPPNATAVDPEIDQLYREQRTEIEGFLTKGLAIREKALGPDHPGVAMSLNNLAKHRCVRYEDRHSEAEPIFKRALAIRKNVFGQNHPDAALTLSDLATMCYLPLNRLAEAEKLLIQSIEILETVLGLDRPNGDDSQEVLGSVDIYDSLFDADVIQPSF